MDANDRVAESFEAGYESGAKTGAATPNEAEAGLEAAGLKVTNTNMSCYLNGNDDGVEGDTWRLDLGRRSTQDMLEGLGLTS